MIKIQEKIKFIFNFLKTTNYKKLTKELVFFFNFSLLVLIYIINSFLRWIIRVLQLIPFLKRPLEPVRKYIERIYKLILSKCFCNTNVQGSIASVDLIILAIRHLKAKKNRTIITIGGMAIGFGSVVFLLSLGYGVQELVISRVARLGEMKQTDVSIGQAGALSLNDEAISNFLEIDGVKSVLPVVSVVSKVTYNNSVSDVIAYSVTKEFLEESAIKPSKGKIFEDEEVAVQLLELEQQGIVAGAQTERISGVKMNKQFSDVTYSLYPSVWKEVRDEPSLKSNIIGYTKRDVGDQYAVEVWGNHYSSALDLPEGLDYFNNEYSTWIKDDFPLWKKEQCDVANYDCFDGDFILQKSGSLQQISTGFITEDDVTLTRYDINYGSTPKLEEGEVVEKIQFSFPHNRKIPVYSDFNTASKMLMLYSGQSNEDTLYSGELVFGESYYDEDKWGSVGLNENNKEVGYWVRAKLPLWRQLDCHNCEDLFIKEVDDYDNQIEAYAFVPANVVDIEGLTEPIIFGQVLGDATESAKVASGSGSLAETTNIADSTDIIAKDGSVITPVQQPDGTLDWVTISSGSAAEQVVNIDEIPFSQNSKKQVLVNRAMLNILGIDKDEAIGEYFEASLMLDAAFFKEDGYQARSQLTKLKIIGVIPEEKTPSFYLPFSDVKSLGVDNYSQLKVIVNEKNQLKEVRREIEAMGYRTSSVVDTVGKINDLFKTVHLLLSVLGLIALSVAALGMFNTLTVSLMEKTREVGLMKAMGMQSNEVKRLFLAESIVIGLSGGILGLFMGIIAGYVLSFFISTISVVHGSGFINLVYVPISLAIGIITLSFIVGIGTGLYPAHRATKISALNALRYE